MLKIALLSQWHVHAKGYANEFAQREDCEITYVWDEDEERGKAWAKEFDAKFEKDLDKILASNQVDAVSVTTPTNLHTDILIKAAKASKHIFTEKVLAITLEDALNIREAVNESGVKFVISLPQKCKPENIYAKKAIQDGLIGDITYARIRNAHSGVSDGWLPATFFNAEQCGGGAMMDLGAHPMYLLPWLLGQPINITSTYTDYMALGVDDNCVSVMEFENKVIAVCETAFVACMCPYILELSGTKGTLLIQGNKLKYISKDTNSQWVMPLLPTGGKMPIDTFVDAILNDEKINPETYTIDNAVNLTRIMEAGYKSNNTSAKVYL